MLCPVKSSYYPQPIGYAHSAPSTSHKPRGFPVAGVIPPTIVLSITLLCPSFLLQGCGVSEAK